MSSKPKALNTVLKQAQQINLALTNKAYVNNTDDSTKQKGLVIKRAIPEHWLKDWLLHVIDKPNTFFYTAPDYLLTPQQHNKFLEGVTKMQNGMPLAYLIGEQEFWSLPFYVNEHTLIPRPDTELLVEQTIEFIKLRFKALLAQNTIGGYNNLEQLHILELGTGSGCIIISLATELKKISNQYNKRCQISYIAVDKSSKELKVAQKNADRHNCNFIQFKQSSWYEQLNNPAKFDVIVSNPPYISNDDEHLNTLQAEPLSALIAADNGLSDLQHIIKLAPKFLNYQGMLAVEHGYQQKYRVQQLFLDAGFTDVATIKDYGGNDRVTKGLWI